MKMQQDFTQGNIFKPLIGFVVPILAALFLQMLYGAVDMMIVGWYCPPKEIAAVSTGSIIMHNITLVVVALSLGTTVLMGQKFGEGRNNELGGVIGSSICLFGLIAVVIAISMQWLSDDFIRLMRTPEAAQPSAIAYLRICMGGAPFIVAYNVLSSIFRGMGNSRIPLLTVAIACSTNMVGDWILVGKVGMGPAGAAVATVGAQGVSVLLSLLIIAHRGLPFPFSTKDIRFNGKNIRRILRLGAPIAIQDALVNVSFLIIAAIVNTLGVVAAAGIGIAERVCGFVMLFPSSYGQAMSTFTAQNIGAHHPQRARRALLYAFSSSLCAGIIIGYITFFHGDILTAFFVQDQPEVAAASWEYLRAYAIDCLLTSFLFSFIGFFNGYGKTTFVLWQGLVGAFLMRIPMSWYMSRLVPVSIFKIGLATPCASVLQITLCLWYFLRLKRRERAS